MEWRAICVHCHGGEQRELDSCKNGAWVEAVAKRHKKENPGHTVLVAYEVSEEK